MNPPDAGLRWLVPLLLLISAEEALSQPVVATPGRAMERLVANLVAALPAIDPVPSALLLVSLGSAEASAEFRRRLSEEGFSLTDRPGPGVLELTWHELGTDQFRLAITGEPTRSWTGRYGDAACSENPQPDLVVTTGRSSRSLREARASARQNLVDQVSARIAEPGLGSEAHLLWTSDHREFVAEEPNAAGASYCVSLGYHLTSERAQELRGALSATRRAHFRGVLLRSAGTLGILVAAALACVALDLRTRGWMTRRLRIGFSLSALFLVSYLWMTPL